MAKASMCVSALVLLIASLTQSFAASVDVNSKSVGVVAGDDAWLPRVIDLSRQIDNEQGLRVLPIASAGCMQSAADVLRLDHVDAALLTIDCVAYAQAQGLLPNAMRKLAYVARVEALPIVLITRKNITTLTALAGKRIATGPAHTAAFATGELVLGGMGLPFRRVAKSGASALSALENGEADAVLLLGLEHLSSRFNVDGFHALGLAAPAALAEVYSPILLPPEKLRGLAKGQDFETITTALTLVALQKPRNAIQQKRLTLFSSVYFEQQQALGNAAQLSTTLAGWQRQASSALALQALDTTTLQPENFQQGDGP
jgi:hypothetical protein